MALVPCRDYGHSISTTAPACPKCGAPGPAAQIHYAPPAPAPRRGTNPWMVIGWILLLLLLLPLATCVMVIGSGTYSDYQKESERQRQLREQRP